MQPLRVATWNIRKAVGLDRRRDPERVFRVIRGLDAQVVALQEADKRLFDRPSALPPDQIAEATGLVPVKIDNGRSLGWHGNALLVRPEMQVARVSALDLPGFEPRGALLAEVSSGTQFYRIISVHLGLARRHRRRQIRHLLDEIGTLPPCATVIMGDFNEWSEDKGLEDLPARFQVHAPGPSFHAARPVAALDRIAHDEGFQLSRAGVARAEGETHGSDHLPVWAELVQSDRADRQSG